MARFSVGDEEGEQETAASAAKRARRDPETASELQESGGNQSMEEGSEAQSEECGGGERNGGIAVTVGPDVLDCSICCEPLRPPLFQCHNGHVACSSCSTKLPEGKCPTCACSINFSRCRALEKVIESIKSSCCYYKYGCRKTLPYIEILCHQAMCMFAPCFCPMSNCSFSGTLEMVSEHLAKKHHGSAIDFQFGKPFEVSLEQNKPLIVLLEQQDLLFLLLNDRSLHVGNALSVASIHPKPQECDFRYELILSSSGSSLQLITSTVNPRKWVGIYLNKVYLLVPNNFCSSSGEIIVNVQIQRKESGS